MATTIELATLFVVETAASLLSKGLDIAQAVGLPVTSWRVGDPTRTDFEYLAEVLANLEGQNAEFIKAGFLRFAEDEWLTVLAEDVYGPERVEATAATPTVTITNGGGGVYPITDGSLTFKASGTGATFHCVLEADELLSPGDTLTLDLVADVDGSDGTVGVDEIDEIVTTMLGVTIDSSTAAVGVDKETDDALKTRCLASRGALSPDGPPDAYEYVATNSDLTGIDTVTRARSTHDSTIGHVTCYVAGPSGAVDGASVTAVQDALEEWATPLCITPTAESAVNVPVTLIVEISGDLPADYEDVIEGAFQEYLATLPIADEGGGLVARSKIDAAIHAVLTLDYVNILLPVVNVAYDAGEVPVAGAITIAVV